MSDQEVSQSEVLLDARQCSAQLMLCNRQHLSVTGDFANNLVDDALRSWGYGRVNVVKPHVDFGVCIER